MTAPSSSSSSKRSDQVSTLLGENSMAVANVCNLPSSIIAQLAKSNTILKMQCLELEQLRSERAEYNTETLRLRSQLMDLEAKYRYNNERFSEQESFLDQLNGELKDLMREKAQLEIKNAELERKYRQTKAASKEFARVIDQSDMERMRLAEIEDDVRLNVLEMSRRKHLHDTEGERLTKRYMEDRETLIAAYESSQLELENLAFELEKERNLSRSLQDDLEKERRMLLERDDKLEELSRKLTNTELKSDQASEAAVQAASDLALERARCDEYALALEESEQSLKQMRSDVMDYQADNDYLSTAVMDLRTQNASLNAKLEAQGVDLINTKRTLRDLQKTKQ